MKLLYVANARIPTEKAHGVAIMRACEAFTAAGVDTTLVVARRRNPLHGDIAVHYGFAVKTPIVRLASLDLYGLVPERTAFAVQTGTFYLSLVAWAMFRSRRTLVYTRDLPAVGLVRLGFKVIYECHHISSGRARFFVRVRRATKIVVISNALKRAFVEDNFDPEHVLVAPSGVALDVFDITVSKEEARSQLNLVAGSFLAVYTGNFTTFGEDKGIEDMLKALVQAPSAGFLAVGGSTEDIARYRTLAQKMGVSERVQLLGSAPQQRLALYQKAADALVMPFPDKPHYRHHMSPVKMFEYMASGRPIIASDLPTIREVLNEDNAYLVPSGDPAALAETLERVRQNQAEAQGRAKTAATGVLRYSWAERTRKILRFIEL